MLALNPTVDHAQAAAYELHADETRVSSRG